MIYPENKPRAVNQDKKKPMLLNRDIKMKKKNNNNLITLYKKIKATLAILTI